MRIFTTLLSLSTGVGALLADDFKLHKRADAIVSELGPYLSPGASIVLPTGNTTLFAELAKRYVQYVHPEITAIVRVGTGDDVPKIIKYARRKNRAILAGSGRHGWGHSLNNVHDAIMIDIATLTQITVDGSSNTMTVGGGVKIGNVMATVQAAGKEAATGICDCVGLLGATLGGGHGRLQGLHGLMVDNLISVRLATATGEHITVSNSSHPDLYWALRGAGHNFGIVTEAVYKVYDQTNGGTQFNANIMYAAEQIEALFTAVDAFDPPAETSALISFVSRPANTPLITLSFVSSSSAEVAIPQLDSAFGHIPYISRTQLMVPWASVNELGVLGLGRSACVGDARRDASGASMRHYEIPAMRTIYDKFVNFTTTNPSASSTMMLFETYSVKGVQAVPAVNTAYPHRDERHVVLLMAGYPNATLDTAAQEWIVDTTSILHATGGFEKPAVYMNYAQGIEGFGALYGYEEWRQTKLKYLKKKYDPEAVFSGYQPIPV